MVRTLVVIVLALLTLLSASAVSQEGALVIVGGTLIDGTGRAPQSGVSILVQDEPESALTFAGIRTPPRSGPCGTLFSRRSRLPTMPG